MRKAYVVINLVLISSSILVVHW